LRDIISLFLRVLAVLKLGVDDLVELDEGSYEFFAHHSLDLSRRVLQPEVVDLILPSNILGEFVVNADSSVELLGENGA
jgi:hypothetical protein